MSMVEKDKIHSHALTSKLLDNPDKPFVDIIYGHITKSITSTNSKESCLKGKMAE